MNKMLVVVASFFSLALALPASAATVSLLPTADTYVINNNADTNFGTLDTAYISYMAGPLYARTLLKFDLSSIPTGSVVNSATLSLNLASYGTTNTVQIGTYFANGAWTEAGATWTNQPAVGDVVKTQLVNFSTPQTWDVLPAVQAWVAGTKTNDGLVIKTAEGAGATVTDGYWTREATQSSNAPTLVVDYTAPAPVVVSISGVSTATVSSAATVSFTTNVNASGTIEYGTTNAYGQTKTEVDPPSTIHAITLTGLTASTTYHFRVVAGTASTDDLTFTTGAAPVVLNPLAKSLVKIASSDSVYYVGTDGKRHAFPNDKVYKSWYPDFTNVKTIADADMAKLALGKNVTYRPGTRLVKFQSLAKTYAVDDGGTLRWVKDEATAKALYGSAWAGGVEDISDTFYMDYVFGADIASTSDYYPANAMNGTPTIDDNF